jgi:hypothetical protein
MQPVQGHRLLTPDERPGRQNQAHFRSCRRRAIPLAIGAIRFAFNTSI